MAPNALPAWVAVPIVAVDLVMAALVYGGLTRLARRPGVLPHGTDLTRFDRRVAALVCGWIAAALLVTFVLANPPSIAVLAYVVVVTGTGYALATGTETGWRLLRAVPQTWLIGAQLYRAVGAVFLVALAVDVVPAYFALPAGWGDIATGLAAVGVAAAWAARRPFAAGAAWVWNLFGFADLVIAVGIGSSLLAAPAAALIGGSPAWVARAATGFQPLGNSIFPVSFPLALIPAFVVPLGFLLHLLSMRKLLGLAHPAPAKPHRTATAAAN